MICLKEKKKKIKSGEFCMNDENKNDLRKSTKTCLLQRNTENKMEAQHRSSAAGEDEWSQSPLQSAAV